MKTKPAFALIAICCLLSTINHQLSTACAQGTAFSYQGQLQNNGVPASGTYNLQFTLYTNSAGGTAVAGPVTNNAVSVTNGLFSAVIDFGSSVWNGQTNWLQIGVETNGTAAFTLLTPLQELTPVPYAIFAESANAAQLSGTVPLAQLPAGVVTTNETSVTLDNLTLDGALELPAITATPLTVNSGTNLLLYADDDGNFFAGEAGNVTMSGSLNTANGYAALNSNTSGSENTAIGVAALFENTNGSENTANGYGALLFNLNGSDNTADGYEALLNLGINSGVGGNNNIALGYYAGGAFTTNESYNIDIGNPGVAGESGVIRIGTPGIQTTDYLAGVIIGNGGGLTNLNFSGGTVSLSQLPAGVVTNTEAGVTLSGVFSGNGGGLTNLNVNVAQLSGALSLTQLPASVVTTNETAVTLDNLTLDGALELPAITATSPNVISSGGNLLLYADNNNNFFIGGAGNSTTSGYENTANGAYALQDDTSGSYNTANGATTLFNNTSGYDNTANGDAALYLNTSGYDNTANGAYALFGNMSGSYNTANGMQALYLNVSGSYNTAVGYQALLQLGFNLGNGDGGTNNIAIGYQAGWNFTANESYNIDIGNAGVAGESGVIRIGTAGIQTTDYLAGVIIGNGGGLTNLNVNAAQLSGTVPLAQLPPDVVTNDETSSVTLDNLTLDGALELPAITATPLTIDSGTNLLLYADNNDNFFVGPEAGNLTTSGYDNTANGFETLNANTTGFENTANGFGALNANTTGFGNTANGFGALHDNTNGFANTANGYGALNDNTSGNYNTANGNDALYNNANGSGNTANGVDALYNNTSASGNTANGNVALYYNTSGSNNTANGYGALFDNTVGNYNTANGVDALYGNTNGYWNMANGYQALYNNTSGSGNTANGYQALFDNSNGYWNTANGYQALFNNSSGYYNTANGYQTLYSNTSGSQNTAVGYGALNNLTTGGENIALGYYAGGALTSGEIGDIDIGNPGVAGESAIIRIGNNQEATYLSGNVYATSFNATSDRNAKENFTSINPEMVLAKVASLPLTKWNYKTDKNAEHIGPMAQDFKAAFGLNGRDDKHISMVDEGGVALAAIQGLNEKAESENEKAETQIGELKAENAELREQNVSLAKQLNDLAAAVKSLQEKSGH